MDGFKINRQLLDSDFEGYRLSLDKIAGYNIPLREELLIVNIPSHQYSLQHVKLFASHNHLIQERWNSNILYFISKDVKVYSVCNLPEENSLKGAANVFSLCDNLPSSITREGVEIDLYNPTLTFPSESLAVLCDGCGSFYILETGDRNLQQTWSVLHSETKEYGFSIYDSLSIESNEDSEKRIALVTGHIVENEGEKKGFRTVITRILLVCGSEGLWREESSEEFTAYNVEYVSLGAPDSLFVASQTYSFSPAADDSLASGDVSLKQSPGGDSGPAYVWLQADEDITVTFNLQGFQNLDKKEVNVIFSRNSIAVSVQGRQLLCGDLFSPITASECTWTLADGNRRLEVYLTKSAGDWWSELVSGDSRGEMITDSDVADRIHENLSYLTTDTMENGDQSGRSAVNGQDLEECDLVEVMALAILVVVC
ncbi:hypothetical protein EB796_007404 [Bugula neritina]|uniref:NudC domain-containing protein 1 n=1 Tax=Bugula neritina TaxID=10212 RepID=A0A7J7K6P7_BUGNE|nr:hypothetical protein EB796_007404 [Bugula neritina]